MFIPLTTLPIFRIQMTDPKRIAEKGGKGTEAENIVISVGYVVFTCDQLIPFMPFHPIFSAFQDDNNKEECLKFAKRE